jgi:hypothetical protein
MDLLNYGTKFPYVNDLNLGWNNLELSNKYTVGQTPPLLRVEKKFGVSPYQV